MRNRNPTFVDITGRRYGRLVVLKEAGYYGPRMRLLWSCQCDCGNITTSTRGDDLKANKVISCGCIHKDNVFRLLRGEASFNTLYRRYQHNASISGRSFNLSKEEFKRIVCQNCYYCGVVPKQYDKKVRNGYFIYNGIDRRDNKQGYISINCVPCCIVCNRSKGTKTELEFYDWIKKTYEHVQSRVNSY